MCSERKSFGSAFRHGEPSSQTSNRAAGTPCHDATSTATRPGRSSGRAAYHQPALRSLRLPSGPQLESVSRSLPAAVPERPRARPVTAGSDGGDRPGSTTCSLHPRTPSCSLVVYTTTCSLHPRTPSRGRRRTLVPSSLWLRP